MLLLIITVLSIKALVIRAFKGSEQFDEMRSVTGMRIGDISKCHYLFFDFGANLGLHQRYLFEPELYEDAIYPHKIFESRMPTDRKTSSICSFAFEPNPLHGERLSQLESYYSSTGRYIRIFPFGLSNTTESISFYKPPPPGKKNDYLTQELGFSMYNRKKDVSEDDIITVNTVDAGLFLYHLFVELNIGDTQQLITPQPTVLMKLDVEGAEYVILRSMIVLGVLCRFNLITAEWHHEKIPCNIADCPHFVKTIMKLIDISQDDSYCKLEGLLQFDDESFKHGDPHEIPEIPKRKLGSMENLDSSLGLKNTSPSTYEKYVNRLLFNKDEHALIADVRVRSLIEELDSMHDEWAAEVIAKRNKRQ